MVRASIFIDAPFSGETPPVPDAIPHFVTEICPSLAPWMQTIASRLQRGWMLLIDYGHPAAVRYHPARAAGTLAAYRDHQRQDDPLADPGPTRPHRPRRLHCRRATRQQDAGLTLAGFTDQHHALTALAARVFPAMPADTTLRPTRAREMRALRQLLHPESMGTSFKFLALARNTDTPLTAFQFAREPHGTSFSHDRPTPEQREAARHPDPRQRTVMHQRWENLLFLHWAIEPRPHPTHPSARTPRRHLRRHRLARSRALCHARRPARPDSPPSVTLSNFLELNVRTYVHDDRGVPGVWFYSLDCHQSLAVLIARLFFSLPYQHAKMQADFGPVIDYRSTRRGTSDEARFVWRPQGPARPAAATRLEFFLLERYHLYSLRRGRLLRGTVAHAPYEFREATVDQFSTIPATLAGFANLSPQPQHICHADGVEVRILGLERLP